MAATAGNYTFDWQSGTIHDFQWVCSSTPGKPIERGTATLIASAAAKQTENYAEIAANFDTVK